jgi:hypothetical protein
MRRQPDRQLTCALTCACVCGVSEPGFDYAAGLSPFHGLKCRTAYCPIDPRLTFVEANAVIRAHMPTTVVVPAAYTTGKGDVTSWPCSSRSLASLIPIPRTHTHTHTTAHARPHTHDRTRTRDTGGPITEANSIIAMTRQTITYRPLDVIALPSHRKQTQAALSAELAMSLKLQK